MDIEKRERILEIVQMRLDGKTYAEIGEAYGVSRQRIEQIIATRIGGGKKTGSRKPISQRGYVLPFVVKYMDEKNMNASQLAKLLGIHPMTCMAFLRGARKPTAGFVLKLVKCCGLTIDEAETVDEASLESRCAKKKHII